MSKILITGGAGFIGAHLAKRLVKDGHRITVVDNLARGESSRLSDIKEKITFENIDLRHDFKKLLKISEGIDLIFHLAAINGTENFYKHSDLVLDVGIFGMLNVLNTVEKNNIKNLIVASSAEVYQLAKKIPTPENTELKIPDPYEPRYSYAASKIISEQLTLAYLRSKRIQKAILFRPHNVYGPDMGNKHVIPQFLNRASKIAKKKYKESFSLYGDGNETRAFCYIDDIIDGLKIIMKKGKSGEIYHIGNDEEISIEHLFQIINKYHKDRLRLKFKKGVSGSPQRRCPEISKMRNLGFSPKFNINDGLKKTKEWYKKNYKPEKNNKLL